MSTRRNKAHGPNGTELLEERDQRTVDVSIPVGPDRTVVLREAEDTGAEVSASGVFDLALTVEERIDPDTPIKEADSDQILEYKAKKRRAAETAHRLRLDIQQSIRFLAEGVFNNRFVGKSKKLVQLSECLRAEIKLLKGYISKELDDESLALAGSILGPSKVVVDLELNPDINVDYVLAALIRIHALLETLESNLESLSWDPLKRYNKCMSWNDELKKIAEILKKGDFERIAGEQHFTDLEAKA